MLIGSNSNGAVSMPYTCTRVAAGALGAMPTHVLWQCNIQAPRCGPHLHARARNQAGGQERQVKRAAVRCFGPGGRRGLWVPVLPVSGAASTQR
jgi:hypothetical protein